MHGINCVSAANEHKTMKLSNNCVLNITQQCKILLARGCTTNCVLRPIVYNCVVEITQKCKSALTTVLSTYNCALRPIVYTCVLKITRQCKTNNCAQH